MFKYLRLNQLFRYFSVLNTFLEIPKENRTNNSDKEIQVKRSINVAS